MNGDQEPYQPLPFIPISMCTCNCTCKSAKSRKVKSVKRFDLASGVTSKHLPATTTTSCTNSWHVNGNSRNALHEQQQWLQSTVKRKSDQSQQTEPIPSCLFPAFTDVVTQQPLAAPPFTYSQSISMPSTLSTTATGLASATATTTLTATTLRERIQVSFGASQAKTNLISAAFIHRLKQRVQQHREEVIVTEERLISEDGSLSSSEKEEEEEEEEEGETEFHTSRRFKPRRPRGPSISRRAHLFPHHRSSLNNSSSTTSPKVTTSLAALSLRSSPPPPPAPPCIRRHHIPPSTPALKSLCQEAEDLLPLTSTTANLTPPPHSASFKKRVNFVYGAQVDEMPSQTQTQNRSMEEPEAVVKIKPAIKKADVKDADAVVNGKRSLLQRSVAFVDEIDSKKLCNTDKEAGGKKMN